MIKRMYLKSLLLAILMALPWATSFADDSRDSKPFAEVHVVLQLSDQSNEAVVLDVANNLIKNYGGPDNIDIEIVTFGKGVRLMFAGSEHEIRIASLVDNGVRFYVCENTLDTGVARIIESVAEGYTLVRP